jgi:hypothetical protein
MLNLLLLVCILASGAGFAIAAVLMEGIADEWRHDRAERRMVARVEARRRWVEERGSFPAVTGRRR